MKRYLIALSAAVAATAIVSLYIVHSELVSEKEKALTDKQNQIDLLLLYSEDLSDKLRVYELEMGELRSDGCAPPPTFDKKPQTDL